MEYRVRMLCWAWVLGLTGTVLLTAGLIGVLWNQSFVAEENRAIGLAAALGRRTEAILIDTRDLLAALDRLPAARCSEQHLQALQKAAATRPHLRALGHWRANQRLCGTGFVGSEGLRPPQADRIYDNGVLAWWPGQHTQVGGLPLFLMRFGDHDAAIDPRQLIDPGTLQDRQAGLWVEGLRMASAPADAVLPLPMDVPAGLSLDYKALRITSRFSQNVPLPIDVVAIEPLASFWSRHRAMFVLSAGLALGGLAAWALLVQRWLRVQLGPEASLRRALRERRIVAHYQPIIEFDSGRCVGAEALARWQHDDGEPRGPHTFLPLAEQCGLMPAITQAVLDAVLRDLPALLARSPELSISLNLAAEDLGNESFARSLARGLQRTGIAPQQIKLEITERGLVNSQLAREVISGFRADGHAVAVDDFGTGYSNLAYLESFQLDILKIDKSFVDAIETEAATSQVIVHVIDMARSLGLDLIAEGVQSPEQVRWLSARGVRLGQGFLYSRPLAPERFQAFLRDNAVTIALSVQLRATAPARAQS